MSEPYTLPSTAVDDAGFIVDEVPCLACGYNLRGTNLNGRCPECGTAVGRSAHGDLLLYCEPTWVSQLAKGMNFVLVSILVGFLIGCLSSSAVAYSASQHAQPQVQWVQLLHLVPNIIALVGYWLLTTPEPRQQMTEAGLSARSLARGCLVAAQGLGVMQIGVSLGQPFVAQILAMPGAILSIVGLVALLVYLRRIALRMPDTNLASQTLVVMWGTAALYAFLVLIAVVVLVIGVNISRGSQSGQLSAGVGVMAALGCVVGVLAIVFGIWALVLVFWYRKRLMTASSQAKETWAREAEPITVTP
ncbi:MAG: hypothetical protein GC164_14755 [Phycisphaera sp.]|nr:hypothetical protein [Phycisphaera sp.]